MAAWLMRAFKQGGFVLDHAPDAATAASLLAGNEYDAVVLDLRLPDKHGLVLLADTAPGRQPHAGAGADGPGRVAGQGEGPERRRRRLPDQALRARGTGGAPGRAGAPQPRQRAAAAVRLPRMRPRQPRLQLWRRLAAADARAKARRWRCCSRAAARPWRSRICPARCFRATAVSARTPSSRCCTGCAASWPAATCASSPCAGWATCWKASRMSQTPG